MNDNDHRRSLRGEDAPFDAVGRVAAGEEIVITKHGKPVARLVGARQIDRARVNTAFEKLKALRKGTTLGDLSWKELRNEGRP